LLMTAPDVCAPPESWAFRLRLATGEEDGTIAEEP
jgi:hypothetical protein